MKKFENKRNVFRVTLPIEMCGKISIYRFKEKVIKSGISNICILDVGAEGIQLKSRLNLPIKNTIYKVSFELYNFNYELECELKWKKENNNGSFYYGAMFHQTEHEKEELMKVMTALSLEMKRNNKDAYEYCRKQCFNFK